MSRVDHETIYTTLWISGEHIHAPSALVGTFVLVRIFRTTFFYNTTGDYTVPVYNVYKAVMA